MIVRMTINDNDYTEVIEQFADNLFDKLMFDNRLDNYDKAVTRYGKEAVLEMFHTEKQIQRILNPNVTKNLTLDDSTLLTAVLWIRWYDFIDKSSYKASTKDYLKKNFEFSFTYTYEDKWENGEVVYYFTTARKLISQ